MTIWRLPQQAVNMYIYRQPLLPVAVAGWQQWQSRKMQWVCHLVMLSTMDILSLPCSTALGNTTAVCITISIGLHCKKFQCRILNINWRTKWSCLFCIIAIIPSIMIFSLDITAVSVLTLVVWISAATDCTVHFSVCNINNILNVLLFKVAYDVHAGVVGWTGECRLAQSLSQVRLRLWR